MYVDKRSHYVVFYTVETTKNGDKIMKVRKNIHSTELKKELEEKDIKPLFLFICSLSFTVFL